MVLAFVAVARPALASWRPLKTPLSGRLSSVIRRLRGPRTIAWVVLLLGCTEASPPASTAPSPAVPRRNTPLAPESDAGPESLTATAERSLSALVLSLGGAVEVKRVGTDKWVALSVGDAVAVGDEVQTGPDGHLELSFGVAEVRLHGRSRLELTVLEVREVRGNMAGALGAHSKTDGGSKLVGEISAQPHKGQVAFSFDGQTLLANVLKGSATLSANGRAVKLKPGQFSSTRGEGPSKPDSSAQAVELNVQWPPETETNNPLLKLSGSVRPGTRVSIGNRRVEVLPDGTFTATVNLSRGRQNIVIVGVDTLGRRTTRSRAYILDSSAPHLKGTVEYK